MVLWWRIEAGEKSWINGKCFRRRKKIESLLQDETVHTVRRWVRLGRWGSEAEVGMGGERDTKSLLPHCVCTLPAQSQNASCWFPVCPGTTSRGSWHPFSPSLSSRNGNNGFGGLRRCQRQRLTPPLTSIALHCCHLLTCFFCCHFHWRIWCADGCILTLKHMYCFYAFDSERQRMENQSNTCDKNM